MSEHSTQPSSCTVNFPKPSGWEADLTPGGFVKFRPTLGNVPCWFHRQMQRLCFGVVWRRIDPQPERTDA